MHSALCPHCWLTGIVAMLAVLPFLRSVLRKLTKSDQKVLVEALLNPPEPSKKLKAAAAQYLAVHKVRRFEK